MFVKIQILKDTIPKVFLKMIGHIMLYSFHFQWLRHILKDTNFMRELGNLVEESKACPEPVGIKK